MVTNPVANLKLAVGRVFPYPSGARGAGSRSGSAPTGAGSNNSLDLLSDVKFFALLQKHEARDPAAVTAAEAWEVATGAPLRRCSASAARLAAGEPADFLLVRTDSPELSLGDLTRRPRLRGLGRGRRHHGRRRAGC